LDVISLAYTGMILCRLVSQDLSEDDKYTRQCEYQCMDGRKNPIVSTDAQYWCPRTLYEEKSEKDNG
jgi:hypothetical protein